MHHLAIMNPKRKLIPKILSGEKKIESRRYLMKVAPRDKVHPGDIIYFKDAGKPVTLKAEVEKVLQYDHYSDQQLQEIITKYWWPWGIAFHGSLTWAYTRAKPKKYCILMFLKNPQKIKPFAIDKKWYWSACAWITVSDIENIALRS